MVVKEDRIHGRIHVSLINIWPHKDILEGRNILIFYFEIIYYYFIYYMAVFLIILIYFRHIQGCVCIGKHSCSMKHYSRCLCLYYSLLAGLDTYTCQVQTCDELEKCNDKISLLQNTLPFKQSPVKKNSGFHEMIRLVAICDSEKKTVVSSHLATRGSQHTTNTKVLDRPFLPSFLPLILSVFSP